MNQILTILILFIMGCGALMALSIWYTNAFIRGYVGKKHHFIESILETSVIPEEWRKGVNNKDGSSAIRMQAKALRKMDGLIKYLGSTTLVENDDTRKELLERMRAIRRQWEKGEEKP